MCSSQEIYGMFNRNVPEESLEYFGHWQVPQYRAAYSKHLTDLSRQNVWCAWHGILETLKKGGFVYGEKNEVYYYCICENTSGSKRYKFSLTTWPQIRSLKKKCGNSEPPKSFKLVTSSKPRFLLLQYLWKTRNIKWLLYCKSGKKFIMHSPVVLAHEHVAVTVL